MIRVISLIALVVLKSAAAFCEEPRKVTIGQVTSDPSAYNHKLLEVSGLVSHGFEDFTLLDPGCTSPHGVWLEYLLTHNLLLPRITGAAASPESHR
jgi:hypothetical protein